MLKLLNTTLASIVLVASSAAFGEDVCVAYAKAVAQDKVKAVKTVESTGRLSQSQKAMIQATILTSNVSAPITFSAALKEFSDDGGTNAGTLKYGKFYFSGRETTVVRATYYPGDNEYGSVFLISGDTPELLGQIHDGDVACLGYPDVQ